ncbi:hypothetical protein BSK59_15660 [Paenibacillus odorifer]|uniref:hypothetical protein n=1 Tax=Paenibacillus odorifer TaxID=189426 RepID=UPI00097B1811|nr:hypothetical protein [Paenibacillus odorifer]OME54016.1 hypothetical protein BSK59_15660 [Paenibacillus odorifer]
MTVTKIPAKKPITYKGFKILEEQDKHSDGTVFNVYTKDEWSYGKGFCSVEWEAGNLQEAKDFIDSY